MIIHLLGIILLIGSGSAQSQPCTGPTATTCSPNSQCIYRTDNIGEGGFYCLSCENDSDCNYWSKSLTSTCVSGICSPTFASCGKHSDCPSPTSSACNNNVCEPCSQDQHCSRFTSTPFCDEAGKCVECNYNENCPLFKGDCNETDHICQGCSINENHCARFSLTPVCKNPGYHTEVCVQCISHSDCKNVATAKCSESDTCIPCTESTQCMHFTTTNLCDTSKGSGVCVQCLSESDCPSSTPVCDSTSGKCVECVQNDDCTFIEKPDCHEGLHRCQECSKNSHCSRFSETRVCRISETEDALCVQCIVDSNCTNPDAAQCSESNTCIACIENSHCTHLSPKSVCKTSGGAGTCVQCVTDSDCPTEAAAQCSEGNTCIACTANSHCTHLPPKSICKDPTSAGKCVQCVVDADCPYNAADCRSTTNSCVGCTNNTQCLRFSSTPLCKNPGASTGVCVKCDSHSDCPSDTTAQCSGSTNTCIECTADSHCTHLSPKSICKDLGSGGTCVECAVDTDCPTEIAAQCSTSNTCTACTTNTHCDHFPTKQVCSSPSGGTCVSCTSSSQCTTEPNLFCNTTIGKCVECLADSDCLSTAASHCSLDDNTCVPCTDSSHCEHLVSTTLCTVVGSSPGICTPKCVTNCLQCSNNTSCKVCLPGYYLLNTTSCLATCPDGYWENNQVVTCDMCDATCKTCETNANKCTSCFTPYVLDGSKCIPPLGNSPPTVTLKSSSDPQTFLLVFSNPMAITSEILMESLQFSLSNMNSSDFSLLNITAQPDSKTFKLTFNLTKSMGIETLTVTFENKGIIFDKDGLIINQDSVSAKTIRFTFFSQEEKAAAEALTSIGSTVSNTALASSAGMFLAGGGGMLWTFLGIFQIVNYLLYLNVNYPYNVVAFFQLFSISSIEGLLPNPVEYVAPALYEDMQVGLPSPPKFADNEMDGLFLNNAGATLAGWIVIGALYGCSKLILFTFRTWGRFNRIITTFKEKFEWGFVYNALIGTYPELIIASCLQFVNMDFTTHINRFSSISALIIGACCFWAPFAVTIALESSAEVLGTEAHEKKHGAFYEGFIVESQRNVRPETAYYRRNFMAFIFLRKMTYFSGIVLAYDIPILQVVITCCSGLVLLIFMIKVKPYRNKRDAWMNIGSELLMVLIHLVIFVLAGDDMTQRMSDSQRKNVGWVVIILCGLLVAYNALFIFAQQVLAFWKGLKLLINFLCKRKQKKKAKTKRKYSKTTKSFAPSHTATAQITKQRVKSEIKNYTTAQSRRNSSR